MKTLTLWQPWATLMALGAKKVETRCWSTKHRGPIAIHSAKNMPSKWLGQSRLRPEFRDELADVLNVRRDRDDRSGPRVEDAIKALPKGCVLCVADLVAIEETAKVRGDLSQQELLFGNYEDGRYAWFFENFRVLKFPYACCGNRLLWNLDPSPFLDQIGNQL